jgi:hypothetical protein
MSEATVISMNPEDVDIQDIPNTQGNILDNLDFKSKEEWENTLNEISIEIENFREELARKKYILQFDNDVKDKVKYFKLLSDFIYKELQWTGYEFFTVEALYDNISATMKNVMENPEDDVLLEYATLEAFISLVLKTSGTGAKDVKRRKTIVKPFNNTYFLYEEDVRALKSLQEKYRIVLNAWNDESEKK